MLRFLAAALAGLTLASAPAAAAPTLNVAPTALAVPFDPPINEPLRYSAEHQRFRERAGNKATEYQVRSVEEMRFLKLGGEGGLLQWTTRSAEVEGAPAQRAITRAAVDAVVGKPLTIEVTPAGRPLRVQNWDAFRSELVAALSRNLEQLPQREPKLSAQERAQAAAALQSMISGYRSMSAEAAAAALLTEPRLLFSLGGAKLAAGKPLTFQAKNRVPVIDEEVSTLGRIELLEQDADSITARLTTATDPDDVKKILAARIERLTARLPAEQQKAVQQKIAQLEGLSVGEQLTVEVTLPRGVPDQMTYEKRAQIEDGSVVETRRMQRLD